MDNDVTFEMEFTVKKGRGYVPAEENIEEDSEKFLLLQLIQFLPLL